MTTSSDEKLDKILAQLDQLAELAQLSEWTNNFEQRVAFIQEGIAEVRAGVEQFEAKIFAIEAFLDFLAQEVGVAGYEEWRKPQRHH
jgi:hypothetical protein